MKYFSPIKYGQILFVIMQGCLQLGAQDRMASFQQLGVEQGLISQSYNYYYYQDKQGFVWVSSMSGLNRFDGQEVISYTADKKDSCSLADMEVQSKFVEDRSGRLWFATSEAIHAYNRPEDCFEKYYLPDQSGTSTGCQIIGIDQRSNELWIEYKRNIYRWSLSEKVKADTVPVDSLENSYYGRGLSIATPKEDSSTYLLVPHSAGWTIKQFEQNQTNRIAEYNSELKPGYRVEGFYFQSLDSIWVAADTGLIRFDFKQQKSELIHSTLEEEVSYVRGVVKTGKDQLLIATSKKGLFYLNTQTLEFSRLLSHINGFKGVFPYTIEYLYLANDQIVWLSSPSRGLFYFHLNKNKFDVYLSGERESCKEPLNVIDVAAAENGNLWCLTREGIYVLGASDKLVKHVFRLNNFESVEPFSIYIDQEGIVWVCTQSGFFYKDPNSSDFVNVWEQSIEGDKQFMVLYLNELNESGRRIASTMGGLFELKRQADRWVLDDFLPGKKNEAAASVTHQLKDGTLLISRIWNHLEIRKAAPGWGLDTIFSLQPAVSGIVDGFENGDCWVGTTNGLYHLIRNQTGFNMEADTVFPFSVINGILADTIKKELWLSLNDGLAKYNPKTQTVHLYDVNDGLQGSEFNQWSALRLENDQYVFGGVNGLNLINPNKVEKLPSLDKAIITRIEMRDGRAMPDQYNKGTGKNVTLFEDIVLPYAENSFRIFFSALDYSAFGENRFKFVLDNYDRDTVFIEGQSNYLFNKIPFGDYNLKLWATNSDGLWTKIPVELGIKIKTPWYYSPWFYFAVFALLSYLLYLYYRFRIAQIKKEESFKRKELEFRKKEAEYKLLVAETENAVLRLQMNPHFIFNSMNSISSYILQKDIDTANDYLGRFARLMRMTLKYAERPLISVSEEIELLELYLQTEAMRLERKLSYEFDVPDNFDTDEYLLPTLILQPFVENAIWHGVAHLEKGGLIKIGFKEHEQQLYAYVEDNGVGRAAAQLLKSGRTKHESKAMGITRRRLAFIKEKEGVDTSFQVVDLFDEQKVAAGTRIVLHLPLFE